MPLIFDRATSVHTCPHPRDSKGQRDCIRAIPHRNMGRLARTKPRPYGGGAQLAALICYLRVVVTA